MGCGAIAFVGAGCGADDHPNEARPAKPITITAAISDENVSVSPDGYDTDGRLVRNAAIGAGLVIITATNQSSESVPLVLTGPVEKTSRTIAPGGTTDLQVDLKPGSYQVKAGDSTSIRPTPLHVGPKRSSSQNELLLP